MSGLSICVVTLGLAVSCRAPAADVRDAAWWMRLAQPPSAAAAWSLDRLVGPGGEAHAEGGWYLAPGAAGGTESLCHAPGAASWRSLPGVTSADFEARLRARAEPSAGERYGLAFSRHDANDYYLARVDTRNNNVRLYRRQGGALALLAARDLGVTVGQWHELAVRASGPRVAVALDGEPILQVADGARQPGGIALWADAPARACFDGLWLTTRDAER